MFTKRTESGNRGPRAVWQEIFLRLEIHPAGRRKRPRRRKLQGDIPVRTEWIFLEPERGEADTGSLRAVTAPLTSPPLAEGGWVFRDRAVRAVGQQVKVLDPGQLGPVLVVGLGNRAE